ncbi:MAG: hypothetical protein H6741_24825 [Alphaproteobacteria bacterium]|nr:hypothetical protein [Alphaproteobacteria bacterium]MCB9795932.1 hypothetical protein [Alphaproteobacteria bacterium]
MPLQPPRLSLVALVALPLALIGCGEKDEDTGTPYCSPSVNAGEDLNVTLGATVDLDGSLSGYAEECRQDFELTYSWTFDAVPTDSAIDEAALTDNNSPTASTTSYVPDVVGTYVVNLQVCDEISCSDIDVAVIEVTAGDAAPVADAGPDTTAVAGIRAQLDGSASYDPEGAALTYSWALSSAPACSGLSSNDLFNAETATPSIICDCEGSFVASLAVSDGLQWSPPDYATITCTDGNQAPVADAGEFETLPPCEGDIINLNGYGSYDPEGESLEYSWSVVSVPADSLADISNLSDPADAAPTFTPDVVGEYTFQLEVYDGELWSAPDVVSITTQADEDNRSPVANAGSSVSTDASATCTSSSYVWSCDDCAEQDFDLDGSGSYDPDGDQLTYGWSDASGEVSFIGQASSAAVVLTPPVAASYGSTTTYEWELTLEVADCDLTDTDTVTVSVNCTGSQ